jgi:hypothetical protein
MDKWSRNELKEKKYFYHATYKEYLPSIIEHGLGGKIIRKNFDIDDENKFVYLTTDIAIATEIAEISETIESDDTLVYLLDQIIVLKIDMEKIDMQKIGYDEVIDIEEETPIEDFPYYQYEGVIPFDAVVKVIDHKDAFSNKEV